jgi:molybdenum cofactor biosynthesis enzyme MoaA
MYFAATGRVAPCWIQLEQTEEVWSPERSLLDIYRGREFSHLRRELAAHRFPGACSRCGDDVAEGIQPLARVYDGEPDPADVPTTLELELSNRCNFECQMCQGDLSSLIRKNREGRDPLISPYDDAFVEQVAEVLPHLRSVRFSGGEPFLHPLAHKVIDSIVELRPDLRFSVSTNGSILTPKVRRLLDRTAVHLNVSFDSLQAERYERIREHADFAVLMAHLEVFQEHARTQGGLLTINTNPMRQNWEEMPDFVRWCDERGLYLTFNTVVHPDHMSLRTLPASELRAVHGTLAAVELAPVLHGDPDVTRHNHAQYADVISTVAGWLAEAEQRERAVPVAIGSAPSAG